MCVLGWRGDVCVGMERGCVCWDGEGMCVGMERDVCVGMERGCVCWDGEGMCVEMERDVCVGMERGCVLGWRGDVCVGMERLFLVAHALCSVYYVISLIFDPVHRLPFYSLHPESLHGLI